VLTTSGTSSKPEDIFYIDPDFTKILSSGGISFKELPGEFEAGYYKINTAVLNVRLGPGTQYKKNGALYKGKTVKVVKTQSNWGRLADGRWICLDYCRYM
jgi:uncharacterized protein YgiM (DUF1202 family)